MKKYLLTIAVLIVQACELVDPTEVVNPNVSEETFLELPKISATWLTGLERQLAISMNQNVVLGELLSDNYFNNRTLTNKVFDIPQIVYTDIDVLTWQSEVQLLRSMAEYALETVSVEDESTTDEQRAQFYFYLGVAHQFSGEYFVGLPAEEGGEVLAPSAHFEIAIDAFNKALDLSSDQANQLTYTMAMARVHYLLGNVNEAVSMAETLLSTDPLFLRWVDYDINLQNDMQFYLFDSEANEFAPLPRLDFLDPKFYHVNTPSLERKSIALYKAEEAYFILAEAQLAVGNLDQAKTTLINLLNNVIHTRPLASFTDTDNRDGGTNLNAGIPAYPLSSEYSIFNSEEAKEALQGLVLNRPGVVTVPAISGTSVSEASITSAASVDELLETLYLMRQEVFIAEGKRVVDLGIKVPVAENEFTANANVSESQLEAQMPSFYPTEAYAFDKFTLDEDAKTITIKYNLNKILVENKSSELVVPFF